jgi:hypothetical protein
MGTTKGFKLTTTLIDKVKAKKGRLVRVENESRKFGGNSTYVAMWVEDANGKKERCLLFSEDQIRIAEERAAKNKEDLTKRSFFTDFID